MGQKALQVVATAVRKHMPNPHAAAYCCACLHGLIKENDTAADELDELNGFKLAGACLKAHQSNEQVQQFAGMLFEELKPADYDSAEDNDSDDEEGDAISPQAAEGGAPGALLEPKLAQTTPF